jgi:hypothetical protein
MEKSCSETGRCLYPSGEVSSYVICITASLDVGARTLHGRDTALVDVDVTAFVILTEVSGSRS